MGYSMAHTIWEQTITISYSDLIPEDQRTFYKIFNTDVIPKSKVWFYVWCASFAFDAAAIILALISSLADHSITLYILAIVCLCISTTIQAINLILRAKRKKRFFLWLEHVKHITKE